MQFRTKRLVKPIINIAPMVDVLFLLLIFFMVTSTFVDQPNIKLDLPSTVHANTSKIDEMNLLITRDGNIFLENEIVDINNLENVLRKLVPMMEKKTLVMRADKEVSYGIVIKVMDSAKGAGVHKIVAPTLLDNKTISH